MRKFGYSTSDFNTLEYYLLSYVLDFQGNFISVSETEILACRVSKSNNELEAGLKLARAHKITFCPLFTCTIWDFLCFRAKLERLNLPLEQREICAYERALFLTLARRRCSITWRFPGRFSQITRGLNRKIEKMHRGNYFLWIIINYLLILNYLCNVFWYHPNEQSLLY